MPHPYLYQKIRIRNDDTGGQAATVAGVAGPGFHNWPTGHILQDTDTKALIRIRPPAFTKKTFGKTFDQARAAAVESVFPSPTERLRGQRPQLQKSG